MVFTTAQINSFFRDADQMHIPAETQDRLTTEGIELPGDLIEFD